MIELLLNRISLTGIFALLAFLIAFGVLINPIPLLSSFSLPILVFAGTLIVCIVVGIVVPGVYKLYSLGIVAIYGMIIFVLSCT